MRKMGGMMAERKSVLDSFGGTRGVIVLAIGFVVATSLYRWQTVGSGNAMQEVGAELGLQVFKEGQRWQLSGRIQDIGITVKTTTENLAGDTQWYTDFKLYAPDQPHGRIVGASFRQKAIGGMQGSEWLSTGDTDFDAAVLVEGDPTVMLAHLDAEARAAIIAATDAGWILEDVTWVAREPGRVTSAEKIHSLLDLGLSAARATRLDGVRDAAAAVLEGGENVLPGNTGDLPDSVTRANALEALAEVNTPRSLEAAIRLARDGDDRQEVRNRLVSAVFANDRMDEVIGVLGEIGGQLEIAVLNSVKGQHEEAAKTAIAAIEKRL